MRGDHAGLTGSARTAAFRQSGDGRTLPLLKQIMVVALQDPQAAVSFGAFLERRRGGLRGLPERGADRGAIAGTADLDFLTDLSYGPLWYRGLAGHRPLDVAAARKPAAAVMAGGAAEEEGGRTTWSATPSGPAVPH